MEELIRLLREGHYSLVLSDGRQVRTFAGRGVADLYRLLTETPDLLRGAWIADKVVGKGAAALMALGGVRRVYAATISTAARQLLCDEGVETAFGEEVTFIQNRKGDGMCPVEQLCREVTTAAECLPLIRDFLDRIGNLR